MSYLLIYKRTLFAGILCFCLSLKLFAQENSVPVYKNRRAPLIGLHFSVTDFSAGPFNISKINYGYLLSYLDGIRGKYDYMIQAGSISLKYPIGKVQNDNRGLLQLINIQGLRRFFSDSAFINPFIGVGPGIALYKSYLNPIVSGGAGFQLRISKTAFIHTQLNYQINFSSSINNSVTASIGFLGRIKQRKKKRVIANRHLTNAQQQVTDLDGDGIADIQDACPTVPGPKTFNGCPDTDGDGIPDNKDKCPVLAGIIEYDGCPAPVLKDDEVITKIDTLHSNNQPPLNTDSIATVINTLAQHINFETNVATLTPASGKSLNEIADLLKMLTFKKLLIEGHTDNTGTKKRNEQLSEERAEAVLEYLVKAGIDRKKLTAGGFGASRPIADNKTVEGRAQNRRTVFVLHK